MAEVHLIKMPGSMLRPANQTDADVIQAIENGRMIFADIKQPRNPKFHRKMFALLNFSFEYWRPELNEKQKVLAPEKNFDRFRKDVLILAGFRTMVVNVKNECRYEAASISFASMDELQFHEVYKKVFDVLWRLVLQHVKGLTEAEAENIINGMISFD